MRTSRSRRQSIFDLRRVTLGDYLVLGSSLLALISLFLPWLLTSSSFGSHSDNAFAYSEVASVVVIMFFLATWLLVLYPIVALEVGIPALPFSTPLIFMTLGGILLLLFDYELGRYSCVLCTGVSRGFGVYLAFIAAFIYIIGAIISWGARPSRSR